MRILHVIHQFPPHSSQGSEVYCRDLALALAARGDEVGVFHVSNTRPRFPRRLVRRTDNGLAVFHCIDGAEYARTADWPNTFLRDRFAEVLHEFRPGIVHFHNFISLGDDLVGSARSASARVVYTLHDYGLVCPNALLLRSDGGLCGKADGGYFEACCPVPIRVSGGRTPVVRQLLPSLSRWQALAGQQPPGGPRRLIRDAVGIATTLLGEPRVTDVVAKREFFIQATRRIFDGVDLFLAPSAFLRDRYLACGLAPERVRHVRYGIRHFAPASRTASERVRIGYIGAMHAHKGIDLLIRAFRGLGDRASLHVHGTPFDSPVSIAHAEALRREAGPGTHFHGPYDNARIGEVLAGLDIIVVPSLWYENSPLTIQEAFHGGVPVVTADVGGMAELVRHEIDGLHFRFGDEKSLRATLLGLVDHPKRIAQLRANIAAVPSIGEQAVVVHKCYEELTGDA